jgi:hypothetical protein
MDELVSTLCSHHHRLIATPPAHHDSLPRDTGYEKPTLFNPIGKAQTPSNVTRLSRSLRRVCRDGTLQIIAYQNGVGTGSTMADAITGGAFGRGIAEVSRDSCSSLALFSMA